MSPWPVRTIDAFNSTSLCGRDSINSSPNVNKLMAFSDLLFYISSGNPLLILLFDKALVSLLAFEQRSREALNRFDSSELLVIWRK